MKIFLTYKEADPYWSNDPNPGHYYYHIHANIEDGNYKDYRYVTTSMFVNSMSWDKEETELLDKAMVNLLMHLMVNNREGFNKVKKCEIVDWKGNTIVSPWFEDWKKIEE